MPWKIPDEIPPPEKGCEDKGQTLNQSNKSSHRIENNRKPRELVGDLTALTSSI